MKTKSNYVKTVLICTAIILMAAGIFIITLPKLSADEPAYIEGPDLKVGKYYVDGDMNQYYLEVSENHTIRLVGVDYMEYAMYGQLPTDKLTPEEKALFDEEIQKACEEYAAEYTYLVADSIPGDENEDYMVFTRWNVSKLGLLNGIGYDYIDENTLMGGQGQLFIYRDENSPQTYSAPEKITRIVDAVWSE